MGQLLPANSLGRPNILYSSLASRLWHCIAGVPCAYNEATGLEAGIIVVQHSAVCTAKSMPSITVVSHARTVCLYICSLTS